MNYSSRVIYGNFRKHKRTQKADDQAALALFSFVVGLVVGLVIAAG